MSKIDYQVLRAKAEKATCGVWSLEYGEGRFDGDDALIHREVAGYIPICRIEGAHPESGFDEDFQTEQQANAEFIAAANPATVLALLDERERNQQYIKRRDQENEEIALTVGKLLIENGQLVADTLRHLADNEIDSDYFAITSTNENGTEIDHEMAITDYALQAAGTVDELVAALEVEPIGFRCRRNDNLGDWSYVYHREPDDFERKHLVIEGIYAAPPVPVVPEEKPMPNPLKMYAVDAVAAIAEVRGWNACRAAMLQGKSEQPQNAQQNIPENIPGGNSPVTPDGWISCSDRMPEKGQNVLISVNFDSPLVEPLICSARYTGSTFRRGDATIKPGNGIEQATHWMPLPEPPQEVNRG
ncbi:ead/Ea22-like family protein [Escherichia coli]|nr:ead/Ea22-like family protein [Escherichia coli]EKE4299543.1 ead/Ea22-like family protein [Escherichia coli]HDV1138968.1 ead/Ea22-like family protein [Escherichia coli]HDV1144785.1 ead/Ea22-like family protein [Escherichia coli]HDV1154135.1 ead/Ea22-like family protein [Escherichia coli]